MKKSIVTALISLVIVLALPVGEVSAHYLARDKTIGAVLHVEPNDDPIARSQSSFFFAFKDVTNKFQATNCDCTFLILEKGKNIYSQPLFANSDKPPLSNARVFFTFPQKDVYQVEVVGKPVTPNTFQPFTLKWNFRVDQIATGQDISAGHSHDFLSTHLIHSIVIGIFLSFFLIYFLRNKLHKRITRMRGGEKKYDKENNSTVN